MSLPPQQSYWGLVAREAWKDASRPAWLAGLSGACLVPLLGVAAGLIGRRDVYGLVLLFIAGAAFAAAVTYLTCFLRVPARLLMESERKSRQALAELERTIQQFKAKDAQEAEAARQKRVKDELAGYLDRLNARIAVLRNATYWDYARQYEARSDEESLGLLKEIGQFLEKQIGAGEAAFFRSDAGKIITPVSEPAGLLRAQLSKWQGMMDDLKHRARKLDSIIAKL